MSSFNYNIHSGRGYLDQWNDYLQQKSLHSGTENAMNQFRTEYNEIAQNQIDAINEQSYKIEEQTTAIVGSIENMSFSITGAINDFSEKLDWKITELIDQQKIGNILNQNIAQLLRIPEFQKERQYFIEQGIKHYKNAIIDVDLIKDALDNLLEAEKKEKTDYFVLHRIGLIYLYQPKFVDLEKAKLYLTLAAKYASVETDPTASRIANILSANLSKQFSSENVNVDSIKIIASESFYNAAIACYALGEFQEAYELAMNAFKHHPSSIDAKFIAAKSLSAVNKIENAIPLLYDVISTNRLYAPRTTLDPDFANKDKVKTLLTDLRDKKNNELKNVIQKLKDKYLNFEVLNNRDFEPIESYLKKNTYLDACSGIDFISAFVNRLEKVISANKTHNILTNKYNSLLFLVDNNSLNSSIKDEFDENISNFKIKLRLFSVIIDERYDKETIEIENNISNIQNDFSMLLDTIKSNLKKKSESVNNDINSINLSINQYKAEQNNASNNHIKKRSGILGTIATIFVAFQLYLYPIYLTISLDPGTNGYAFAIIFSFIPILNLFVIIYQLINTIAFANSFYTSLLIFIVAYFAIFLTYKILQKTAMSSNEDKIKPLENKFSEFSKYLKNLNTQIEEFTKLEIY